MEVAAQRSWAEQSAIQATPSMQSRPLSDASEGLNKAREETLEHGLLLAGNDANAACVRIGYRLVLNVVV